MRTHQVTKGAVWVLVATTMTLVGWGALRATTPPGRTAAILSLGCSALVVASMPDRNLFASLIRLTAAILLLTGALLWLQA